MPTFPSARSADEVGVALLAKLKRRDHTLALLTRRVLVPGKRGRGRPRRMRRLRPL